MTDFAGWVRFVDLPTAWFAVWVAVNASLLLAWAPASCRSIRSGRPPPDRRLGH
jgi:hypothetical protein